MTARRRAGQPEDSGFTLIEVLISTVVLGIIASGVTAAIILFFRTTDGTSNRLALSHDSQLLANYLIPDLDSLTGTSQGQPTVVPGSGTCSSGTSFRDLQVPFTDASSQTPYLADYQVNGTVITRTFSRNGVIQGTDEVVHHLYPPDTACFSTLPSAAPWTMTVTTAMPGVDCTVDPLDCYPFSVTGGGRVTTSPSLPSPTLCSNCSTPNLLSLDTNGDGKIDEIIATFDQPLIPNNVADPTKWILWPPPQLTDVSILSVSVSGNTATLTLNEGAAIDTAASGLQVQLVPGNSIRNGANQLASFGPTTVTDGMAPVLPSPTSMVSRDQNGNGMADTVTVTFSETITSPTNDPGQWTPSGLAGVSVTSVSVVNNTATLTLSGAPVDTIAKNFALALTADPNGIQDFSGNQASFSSMPVKDGMAPAPLSIVSKDTFHSGYVNQIVVTFSESLVPSTNVTPWSLAGTIPPGMTISSVNVSGTTATLSLTNSTVPDTATSKLQLRLFRTPPGVVSQATNMVSSFTQPVADGAAPVVVGLTSTNASGGTPGQIGAGDTLTFAFSEQLLTSSLPSNPTITLTPGAGNANDTLAISGLATTIDLGVRNGYVQGSPVTFAASLTTSGVNVTVTVVGNGSGGGTVVAATIGTAMKVTPATTLTDVEGTPATGIFTSPPTRLF